MVYIYRLGLFKGRYYTHIYTKDLQAASTVEEKGIGYGVGMGGGVGAVLLKMFLVCGPPVEPLPYSRTFERVKPVNLQILLSRETNRPNKHKKKLNGSNFESFYFILISVKSPKFRPN